MIAATLLIIGGFMMMLQPVLRGPVNITSVYVGWVLREAWPPPPATPPSLARLLERMP